MSCRQQGRRSTMPLPRSGSFWVSTCPAPTGFSRIKAIAPAQRSTLPPQGEQLALPTFSFKTHIRALALPTLKSYEDLSMRDTCRFPPYRAGRCLAGGKTVYSSASASHDEPAALDTGQKHGRVRKNSEQLGLANIHAALSRREGAPVR